MRIYLSFLYLFLTVSLEAYSYWESTLSVDQDQEIQTIRSECYLNYSTFRFFLAGDFYQRNPEDFTLAASAHGLYLGPLQKQGLYRIPGSGKGVSWAAFTERSSLQLNRESRNSRNQGLAWQNRYTGLFYLFTDEAKSWGVHYTPGAFQSVFIMTENLFYPQYEKDPWFEPEESSAREMMHLSLSCSFLKLGVRLNSTMSLSPYASGGMLGALYGKWKISVLKLEILSVLYHPGYRNSSGEITELFSQSKVKTALPLGCHWIIKGKGEWTGYCNRENWDAELVSSLHWLSSHSMEIRLSGEMEGDSVEGWQKPESALKIQWDRFHWGGSLALSASDSLALQKIQSKVHYRSIELEGSFSEENPWSVEKCGGSWSPGSLKFTLLFSDDFSAMECKCRWKF